MSPHAQARIQVMGLYSSGPFTRIAFVYVRGELEMRRGPVESTGTSVYVISCNY